MTRCIGVLVCVLVYATNAFAELPVVPGAVGYGMETRAAYACGVTPKIDRVTNLNSTGTGSLLAALEDPSPRIVVFEVSGTIDLPYDVYISNPCATVAGQTAPSPGITLKRHGLWIATHDVLLQHLRIRPGDLECNTALGVWGYGTTPYNVVVDHVSVSWAQDESLGVAGAYNVTFWNVLEAEGLNFARGSEWCTGGGSGPGRGMLIYAGSRNVFVANSILSTNPIRNPYQQGDTSLVFTNNLVYQWHSSGGFNAANFDAGGGSSGGPWASVVVGNVFKAGPQTESPGNTWVFVYGTGGGAPWGNQIYRSDNLIDNGGISGLMEEYNGFGYNPNVSWYPIAMPGGFNPAWSGSVEANVLTRAGARPLDRDAVDNRVISDIAYRGGGFISSQDWVGGWPYLPINVRSLSTPANPHGDDDRDGYTNIEEWLHGFASELENGSSTYSPPSQAPQQPQTVQPAGGQPASNGSSSDGTRVPSAAYIIDNYATTWTINYDGTILRDGSPAAGGWGSQILWSRGAIYVLSQGDWWQWMEGYWMYVGSSDPAGNAGSSATPSPAGPSATSSAGVSPDGLSVPSAPSITDNSGSTWTIAEGGVILRDGQYTGGVGEQILWYSGNIYVLAGGGWWLWTGGSWILVG